MRLLNELYDFLDLNDPGSEMNLITRRFIKVIVVMLFFIAASSMIALVYNMLVHGVSENTTFGLIDYV